MTLTMENIGGPVVPGTLGVGVAYEGEDYSDTVQLDVEAADEISHDFNVTVPPGTVRFDVSIDGNDFPFNRVARASDLRITGTEWSAVSDGRIAVVATVLNEGNSDAESVIVIGTVVEDGNTATEGEGGVVLIPAGEERDVEVLLSVPAGENDIVLQVATDSLEAVTDDNSSELTADVVYVQIGYDYTFEPGGYWSDGSANVDVSVSAYNDGVGAFAGTAEVSYSCAGPDPGDDVETGKFEIAMRDGFSAPSETVTLRSSPGMLECRFITQEQGTETHEFEVAAKVVGVSREVWECYSDDTINRHGDIGCAGREDESVVKWDLDRPLRVWATGDRGYINVLWDVLDRLEPLLRMEFEEVRDEDDADLKAWVGMPGEEGPENLRTGNCYDAGGCASRNWDDDGTMTEASIGIWTVDSEYYQLAGLVDRRIEHTTLHELLHALVPFAHRDDPLSVVNIINAADWIEIDGLEESLIRLQRNPLIEPGMTMDEVRRLVVLSDELLDPPDGRRSEPLSPMELLREAYRMLQNADSATWEMEGGWRGARCDFDFGRADYTMADFYGTGADMIRFFGGSDRLFLLSDEEWSREAGEWLMDSSEFWDRTDWRDAFGRIHALLVGALYYANDDDIRVSTVIGGETSLRFMLERSTIALDWARSYELRGRITLDNNTLEIKGYEMDWLFDAVRSNSCERYVIRTSGGEYGVTFDVPDEVYFGTSDDVRRTIDRINGER